MEPVPELCRAMALRSNEIVPLRMNAQRLCDAPKECVDAVTRKLSNAGWIAMAWEPCLWMLYACVAFPRIDDVVVGVHPSSPLTGTAKVQGVAGRLAGGSWGEEETVVDVYRGHFTVRTHAHIFLAHFAQFIQCTCIGSRYLSHSLCVSQKSSHPPPCHSWVFLTSLRSLLSLLRLLRHRHH